MKQLKRQIMKTVKCIHDSKIIQEKKNQLHPSLIRSS